MTRFYGKFVLNRCVYGAAVAALLTAACGSAFAALNDQWYVGFGGGLSVLQPNLADDTIDIDDKRGQVGTLYVGRDFDRRSSGQLQLYSLGKANLNADNGEVSYIGGDASLLYRFLDTRDNSPPGKIFGSSFYGRFGFGFLDRSSDQSLESDTPVYYGVGAGLETYFNTQFSLRLEALYHETDITTATVTLVSRFGGRRPYASLPPTVPIPSTTPARVPSTEQSMTQSAESKSAATDPPTDTSTSTVGESIQERQELDSPSVNIDGKETRVSEWQLIPDTAPKADNTVTPAVQSATDFIAEDDPPLTTVPPAELLPAATASSVTQADEDRDGVVDHRDRCRRSTPGFPVDIRGCALFNGLVPDLSFRDRSAEFNASSYPVLNRLLQSLKDYPAANVEIVAHTDARGSTQQQSELTRQRLRAIGLYLVGRGIAKQRLLLRSFGANRPLFDGSTLSDQQRNNRIEIFENP